MKIIFYQTNVYRYTALMLICSIITLFSFAQTGTYILNGSATQNSCNCYTLTTANPWQGGSVWNAGKINLNEPFDFWFNVFLGCNDGNGADGIVFMLQPISTSIGTSGEGMGFEGVNPSIGIALDTWQNTNRNDPAFDHISIQVNGVITHGSDLAGPVSASSTSNNIEDCQWHTLRIKWDPSTKTLSSFFDGDLRLSVQRDIINTVFNNNPNVFWGFTGATGGSANLQQFCTALNPVFTTNHTNNITCFGEPVSFLNNSESFAPISAYYWDLGDGTISTAQNPEPHLYKKPGIYTVKMALKGFDSCTSDTLKKIITIGSLPKPYFEVFDTCANTSLRIKDLSDNEVGKINKWNWYIDGSFITTQQNPVVNNLTPGEHELQLSVTTEYGCTSGFYKKTFTVHDLPVVDAVFTNGCVNEPVSFKGIQLNNNTTINSWNWTFDDNGNATTQNAMHQFNQPKDYNIRLWATAINGCTSDTVKKTISINRAFAFAGNDTMVVQNEPFTLKGSGNGNFLWTPATGLDNNATQNPTSVLQDDIQYLLTVTTTEGCTANDDVKISVFKGSKIYVPSGFTPDGNGRNDVLKPRYIGIKKLHYFSIYNRWGQKIFTTNDTGKGWDGRILGKEQPTGSFIWVISAEDYAGKVLHLKGTVTLIQ